MFVFGEVQDPNPDTVNLVEDIVRSQLIELVRGQLCLALHRTYLTMLPGRLRSFKHALLLLVAGRDICLRKTSYS